MPNKTYMVVDPRRDHSLRSPRPDLTVSIGTPNTCNRCHTKEEETPQWAADKIVEWYGPKRRQDPHYGEILHAGHRGEQITVIFINNAVYGMTGGQMAPTTMADQITATTPKGRDVTQEGYPLCVSELLAVLPGTTYIERCALSTPSNIRKAKKALKHAFELQMNNAPGLCLVELLSTCPTYWRMSPADATKWIDNEMVKVFPLGRIKG